MESRPIVEGYNAHSFSFVNPRLLTEVGYANYPLIEVNYDIDFKSDSVNVPNSGSVKLTTAIQDMRYYNNPRELNGIIQERLGFTVSEIVYWIIKPDFYASIKRDESGKVSNPKGYILSIKAKDKVTKQVEVIDITKTPKLDGLTTNVSGYITLLDQDTPTIFKFEVSVTTSTSNSGEN